MDQVCLHNKRYVVLMLRDDVTKLRYLEILRHFLLSVCDGFQ